MSKAQLADDNIHQPNMRLESSDYLSSGSETRGSDSASQDDDDEADNLSDSSESLVMPYTKNDIQLPPHPKKLRWTDEATGDDTSLESRRLIPGGRLGNHVWYLEDVPEGSRFRHYSTPNKERRKRKRQQKKRQQVVETEHFTGDDAAATAASGVDLLAITPDDCVEPMSSDPTSFLDEVVPSPSGDDNSDGVESDSTGRSGWGASRALGNVEDTSTLEENAEANIADIKTVDDNDEGTIDAEGASAQKENDFDDDDSMCLEDIEDNNEDEDKEKANLAAGQQIENSIQNIDGFQKEKLVEAMMNDILKSMRAIEKQKRRQEENKKHGSMGPSNADASATLSTVAVNNIEDAGAGPVPDGFSSWEAFGESCNAFHLDPIDNIGIATQSSQGTSSSVSGDEMNDSDFFVDLLTNEIVDDFVKAQAVEWMDDAQKDDDDEDDERGESDADSDELSRNFSDTRIGGDLGQPASQSNAPLILKHRFLAVDGKDGLHSETPVKIGDTSMAAPLATEPRHSSADQIQISHHAYSPLPVRQLRRGKSKKKSKGRKKSFAKKMFKLSLQGEIEETKRRSEIRRLHGTYSSLGRGGISKHGRADAAHMRRQQVPARSSQQQRPRQQRTVTEQRRRGPPQPGRLQGASNTRSDGMRVRTTRSQGSGTSTQQRNSQSSGRSSGGRVGSGQSNVSRIAYGRGAGAGAHGQCRPSKMPSPATGGSSKDPSRPRRQQQQQRSVSGTGTMPRSAAADGNQKEKKKTKKLFPKLNLKEELVEPR
mmetsp:Transcript_22109/g.45770  ORF Transcript_22109/g.45770 Transcript_22109/m.45770 type:complete len:768 (-) Transcript_22109:2355-4658(-)